MRYNAFGFQLFSFSADTDGDFNVSFVSVSVNNWDGSLFDFGRFGKHFQFDAFFMRDLIYIIRDKF